MQKPRKRDFLQRAHANPFSDQNVFYPHNPKDMDWSQYYSDGLPPTILDLGCGYGRYMAYLGAKYTEDNIVGLEIRKKVAEYALQKVQEFNNATVICTNGMLFLVNFFDKHSLSKIFILFPDPHFKKRKQKARIVCKQMLDVYEYVLSDDGEIYIATDVKDLFRDMCDCFNAHEMFVLCKGDDETSLITETDESRRAGIKSGQVFTACFRKMICQDLPSANK